MSGDALVSRRLPSATVANAPQELTNPPPHAIVDLNQHEGKAMCGGGTSIWDAGQRPCVRYATVPERYLDQLERENAELRARLAAKPVAAPVADAVEAGK